MDEKEVWRSKIIEILNHNDMNKENTKDFDNMVDKLMKFTENKVYGDDKCWLQQQIDKDEKFLEKQFNSPFFKLIENLPEGTEIRDNGDTFTFKYPDGKEIVYDSKDKELTIKFLFHFFFTSL